VDAVFDKSNEIDALIDFCTRAPCRTTAAGSINHDS
jgi:hypothetical protein